MIDQQKQEEKFRRITGGDLYPLLWRMALPAMVGMMISSVYSMTDTYFVGKLDKTDLTASVGIVFSLISIIQAVGFWFGYGSGNYISRQLGKKDIEEAEKMASVGFVLAIVTGMVGMIAGLIFVEPLARLLGAGTSPGLMEATVSYLRITLISTPFMLGANVLYNQLRLQGSARDSMLGLMIGMFLNMLLDPVFILMLGMGVAGAALASLIGQISGLILLWFFTGRKGNISIDLKKSKPDLFRVKEILAGGAPNFCRQGITSVSTVFFNQAAGAFGDPAIAAVTIALRVIAMAYALVIGFGQGFQPICAINYGAKNYDRVKTSFRYALITVSFFLIAAAAVIFIGADRIVAGFSGQSDVRSIGASMLRCQCIVIPFMGYYILIGMLLQNIGKFGLATIVTTAESGLFLIPALLILPRISGVTGLEWCKPVSGACAVLLSLLIGTRAWKKYLSCEEKGVS